MKEGPKGQAMRQLLSTYSQTRQAASTGEHSRKQWMSKPHQEETISKNLRGKRIVVILTIFKVSLILGSLWAFKSFRSHLALGH